MNRPTHIQSAGAVLLAGSGEGLRVALLHRIEPDEWRLAKGKLDPGESHEQAAEREVQEEMGVQAPVGDRLGETRYRYATGGEEVGKSVVFFLVRLPELRELTPEARNFDQAVWVTPGDALRLLSWGNEREMVERAVGRVAREAW